MIKITDILITLNVIFLILYLIFSYLHRISNSNDNYQGTYNTVGIFSLTSAILISISIIIYIFYK